MSRVAPILLAALALITMTASSREAPSVTNAAGVDADLLDGLDSSAFARSAHRHDGAYLAIDGKARDAETVDGVDSSALLRRDAVATCAADDDAFIVLAGENARAWRAGECSSVPGPACVGMLGRARAGGLSTGFDAAPGGVSWLAERAGEGVSLRVTYLC